MIALWTLFICAFGFAIYKNFTAVDAHTVHEKTIIQQEIADTNKIESFVTNFAKVYYTWGQSSTAIDQRMQKLQYYLTDELHALNADTVRKDIPVSSTVQDVQIWSVKQVDKNTFDVTFSVSQQITNAEQTQIVTSVYEVSVYVDGMGDMVIIQNPTITSVPAKSDYTPKIAEPNGTVSAQESEEISAFLTTFFKLYPTATEQELSYYIRGGALPVIENENYMFAELVNPIYTKQGDTVKANIVVKYLDQQTGMTQISQFVLFLKLLDGNWKVVG